MDVCATLPYTPGFERSRQKTLGKIPAQPPPLAYRERPAPTGALAPATPSPPALSRFLEEHAHFRPPRFRDKGKGIPKTLPPVIQRLCAGLPTANPTQPSAGSARLD